MLQVTGNGSDRSVTGTVSDISNHDTDSMSEGSSSIQYHTRVDSQEFRFNDNFENRRFEVIQ